MGVGGDFWFLADGAIKLKMGRETGRSESGAQKIMKRDTLWSRIWAKEGGIGGRGARLGLDTGEGGDALLATTNAEVDARQDDKTDEDPDVDVPEVLENAKVLDTGGKDDGDAGGAGIEVEGFGAELYDTDGRDADETDVKEEGVHEGTSGLHGMDGEDEGDAETELEVSVDNAKHQIEGKDSVEDNSEESPHSVHRREPEVQEAVGSKDRVHKDVDEPNEGQTGTQNAEDQVGPIPENADAVGLVSLDSLVPLLLEHVNFVTPVVVDGTAGVLATIFHTILDQRITDLTDQDLTVSELRITDGLGAKAPGSEEVDRGRDEANTSENAEEETSKDCQDSDEVEDE